MRYVQDGQESYPICDFCDLDATAPGITVVSPLGSKGICNKCVDMLRDLMGVNALDDDLYGVGKKVGYY